MAALRDQWQGDREQRQRAMQDRRRAVQASLAQLNQQRQAEARCTSAMLKEFDAELRETVADVRTQNQHELQTTQKYVADLQAVTQQGLAQLKLARIEQQGHQRRKLAKYVDELEECVSEYLSDVSETRQAAAVVDQAKRHRDRALLANQVQELRSDFEADAQARRTFHTELRQAVWGEATETTPTADIHSANHHANGRSPAPDRKRSVSTKLDVLVERAVYEYLQTHLSGARLSDIEAAVGISRLQTVDALQALLQKGLILQKDRTYRLLEERVL